MELQSRHLGILTVSVFVVALCGIAYELIIGSVSSYLLGNSVHQFSITIGLFMFSMGIGSYLSKLVVKNLVETFVVIEIVISLIGGVCSLLLFIVFPEAFPVYHLVMISLILVIGTLVGLEIPILARILSDYKEMRLSIAQVLSVDYLGALVGSLIFPLVLLPFLGLVRSSFAIGLLNISVAIINIWVFRDIWPTRRYAKAMSTALLILAVMAGAIFYGSWLTRYAEGKLYFDQVIFRKQTPFQRIVLTQHGHKKDHRLYLDGHIQFAEEDEYRYHESLVHPVMAMPGAAPKRVLIMGGGDGMAAREILKWETVEHIDLVDIDPEITRICAETEPIARLNGGSLEHAKVHVHNTDAFTFINQPGESYDRVIIDLPDPHNEALSKLYAREFYHMIQRRLSKGGSIICQSSSPFVTRKVYWCIATSMEAAGLHTRHFHITIPAFGIWGFHVASPDPLPDLAELTWPVQTVFLTPETLGAAQVFGADIKRIETPVNSVMEPIIYHLYYDALRTKTTRPDLDV